MDAKALETPAGRETPPAPAAPAAIRHVALLEWTGPKAWKDPREERRLPARLERLLRDGHFAWFRLRPLPGAEGRCWMLFNLAGWGAVRLGKDYGVTRVVAVAADACRGFWSADGGVWWQVEPRGGRGVRVAETAEGAYRAACAPMPWKVPFFDGSGENRRRLERMYAYVAGVLRSGKAGAPAADGAPPGFGRWALRGRLYGDRFRWEAGETW